jgi:aryl-alcohol dehydrogenase-like predicted oxidoreductase
MNIGQAVEGSLKRLQTDYIDLYQAHEDDASVPLQETLEAFAQLIEQGKVRVIGASNYGADRFAEALAMSARLGLPRYETLQPEYNLVSRKGYEKELEPLVIAENVGVINYYALASGFLSGKYRSEADFAKSAARGGSVQKHLNPHGLGVLASLDKVAAAHGATPAQVALAWLIARPGITAPIASATSIPQLKELIGGVTLQLGKDEIAALDKASA